MAAAICTLLAVAAVALIPGVTTCVTMVGLGLEDGVARLFSTVTLPAAPGVEPPRLVLITRIGWNYKHNNEK